MRFTPRRRQPPPADAPQPLPRLRFDLEPAPEVPHPGSRGPSEQGDGERSASRGERLKELAEAGIVAWGEHSYGSPLVHVYPGDRGRLSVGRWCSIADDVEIFLGGEHRPDWVSTYPLREVLGLPGAWESGHPATRGDVAVGNDVWLGRGCVIRSGVTIGDGAIVGAQAVVTRDVRPYAVVAGNPAREVRRRFTDDQVRGLLQVAWWEWTTEQVIASAELLNGGSVDDFLASVAAGRQSTSPA